MRMRRAFSVAVNRILAGICIMAAAASHLMTAEQFRKLPEDGWPPKREDRLGLPAPDGVNGGRRTVDDNSPTPTTDDPVERGHCKK